MVYSNVDFPTRLDGLQFAGAIIAQPSLARCVIFAATSAAAETVTHADVERAILSAIENDWALVWLASPDGPIHTLRFDARGQITRDAIFTLASLTLRT